MGRAEKTGMATSLIDPQLLWENYFSGVIDGAADAVVDYLEEIGAELRHPLEIGQAMKRGEDRFTSICHLPLKLNLTLLKRGREIANTFASFLEMKFGPLHASLQVGDVILEWNDSDLVAPFQCDFEDPTLQVDVQQYSEWVKYTGKHHPKIQKSIQGLDYCEQIELTYAMSSGKKRLIDALIEVIIRYNKFYYYNLIDRNCQDFVCDALEATYFKGGFGDYYNALIKGKTPSIPSKFETHSLLDDYVRLKLQDGSIADVPPQDLELILALYFRYHLESKVKNGVSSEWKCSVEHCCMQEIEKHIELKSMMIYDFKTTD